MRWTIGIVVLAIMACGGSGPAPEEVAREVAERWVRDSVDEMAEYAAERVTEEVPAAGRLADGWLAGQIREGIEWQHMAVRCGDGARCEVTGIAAAVVPVNVLFVMTDTILVDVPFVLRIDVESESVDEWNPNELLTVVRSTAQEPLRRR